MRWRIGILYRISELLEIIRVQPRPRNEIISSFASSSFRNVSIEDVLDTALYGDWIQSDNIDTLECTTQGLELLLLNSAKERLICQIDKLLCLEEPLWASSSTQGRMALAGYAPPEAVQCFREAGLFDEHNDEVVAWWDRLACRFRAAQNEVYVEIGRQGEKLSYELEYNRTGRKPNWIALEYSNAGYDIISSISADNMNRLVIEVKTSVQPWQYADFYLSRAEWNTLVQEEFSKLHIWSVASKAPLYAMVSINELEHHIPTDNGNGVWQKCRIPYACFDPKNIDN